MVFWDMCMCVSVCVYIYRERERESKNIAWSWMTDYNSKKSDVKTSLENHLIFLSNGNRLAVWLSPDQG